MEPQPRRPRRIVPKLFGLMVGITLALSSLAQAPGKLRLMVDPGTGFEFVLDHRFRLQQREVELAPGPHHFSFWAPARRVTDTTITVEPGTLRDFYIRLPYSTEYVAYNKRISAWQSSRNLQRRLPALATVGAGIWTVIRYGKLKDAKEQLDADADEYTRTVVPSDIAALKERTIPLHKDEFRKARGLFYTSAGVTLACAGLTYYLFRRTGKQEKPVFDDAEKVRFDGLVWIPGADGGQWATQLSMTLGR